MRAGPSLLYVSNRKFAGNVGGKKQLQRGGEEEVMVTWDPSFQKFVCGRAGMGGLAAGRQEREDMLQGREMGGPAGEGQGGSGPGLVTS